MFLFPSYKHFSEFEQEPYGFLSENIHQVCQNGIHCVQSIFLRTIFGQNWKFNLLSDFERKIVGPSAEISRLRIKAVRQVCQNFILRHNKTIPRRKETFWKLFGTKKISEFERISLDFCKNLLLVLWKLHSTCSKEILGFFVYWSIIFQMFADFRPKYFEHLMKNIGKGCPNCLLRVQRKSFRTFLRKKQ